MTYRLVIYNEAHDDIFRNADWWALPAFGRFVLPLAGGQRDVEQEGEARFA